LAHGHSRPSYLVALLVFGFLYIGVNLLAGGALVALGKSANGYLFSYLLLGSTILGLPLVLLTARFVHQQPAMSLIAPGRRLDIGMIGRSALIFALPLLATFAYGFWAGDIGPVRVDWGAFLVLTPLTILLFCFQASTEEVIFRGYLSQGLMVLCRNRIAVALLCAALFTLAHEGGINESLWAVRAEIFTTALFLSAVSFQTGRLEAAMGIHIINNALFGLLNGSPELPLPALAERLGRVEEFAGMGDVALFLGVQVAAFGFYWLVGLRSGFVGRLRV
jgi:membrane protease YdiL (CAAX protease family)